MIDFVLPGTAGVGPRGEPAPQWRRLVFDGHVRVGRLEGLKPDDLIEVLACLLFAHGGDASRSGGCLSAIRGRVSAGQRRAAGPGRRSRGRWQPKSTGPLRGISGVGTQLCGEMGIVRA